MDMTNVRVRFAPSPTGIMHLGNVRTALCNYLYAKQKKGVFILRIEDTDPERMFDPEGAQIMADLAWLELTYDEGPAIGGPCAPYYQSQRAHIYQEKLELLQQKNSIYRCFCSTEELAKRRERQLALKQPPRYEKTCLKLSQEVIEYNLTNKLPFIWRFNIANYTTITIHDLARGNVEFDLSHFSDFPLTRQNGTFTFLFANAIDDIVMNISHIVRGEDHLSNTANQAALFLALHASLPIFWHLPILCNTDGKKLSKRDFGFSLLDLKHAGFLPEAINNYLGILGGSYPQEIMTVEELAQNFNFESVHATAGIKYDVEKLRWMNHKWIEKCTPEELFNHALPFLKKAYPEAQNMSNNSIKQLMNVIKSELVTLNDINSAAKFYFVRPTISKSDIQALVNIEQGRKIGQLLEKLEPLLDTVEQFLNRLKQEAKQQNIANKELFAVLRLIVTHTTTGPRIQDIIEVLGREETRTRYKLGIRLLG